MNLKKKLKISLILSLVLVLLFPTMTIFASETKSRAARENIALNKPVTSSKIENSNIPEYAVDGKENTFWASVNPSELEVDLQGFYKISEINLMAYFDVPANAERYYDYEIYASMDQEKYDLVAKKSDTSWNTPQGDTYVFNDTFTAHYIKVKILKTHAENQPNNNTGHIKELRVYGEESENPVIERADINISDFEDTEYALPITEDETINEVKGVLSRVIGEKYLDWFEFVLEENSESDKDYYEISNHNGKIKIKGNEGLSLTTGLNYYLKYYCNVSITQQARQVKMPANVVPVTETIRKETPYEVRYAYNYCTHSYTMAFWGETEWQNEMD